MSVQTNIEGKCAWSDEAIYTRAPIYIMVMHKEAIYSTGILATLKSKLMITAKRRERELYLSSLSNILIYVMVKIIVIS